MDLAVLFFLSSGLFLGWSLGANDAANVFGTAVGTRMVRFGTAAAICCIFVVLGAVISGGGAAQTLGKLGAINALAGAFMAALSAAVSVYLMTRAGVPVSTTQAIIGGIVGWNLFTGTSTDSDTLLTILSTWVICPLLAAVIAALLYQLVVFLLRWVKPHLLRTDAYTRLGLILAGAFGAYSLGANNIANVMGVFVPASPFSDIRLLNFGTLTSVQQLFLVGALAIAVGVATYSKRVMLTVGIGLLPLSPIAAWVAVVAHSLVLFLFASRGLEQLLARNGLPTIPLVPVSSSQAVVGAVLGIGLVRGGRSIRWRVLGGIGLGWLMTPVIACLICFVGLFFLQNVFNQKVHHFTPYVVSAQVLDRLTQEGVATAPLRPLAGKLFVTERLFRAALTGPSDLTEAERDRIVALAQRRELFIDPQRFDRLDQGWLTTGQLLAVQRLAGQRYPHGWLLTEALARLSPEWQLLPESAASTQSNSELRRKLDWLHQVFDVKG